MFHVHLRLVSSRATYRRYQRWINRAALMASVFEKEREEVIHKNAEVIPSYTTHIDHYAHYFTCRGRLLPVAALQSAQSG